MCLKREDGSLLVLLGERNAVSNQGKLHRLLLDLSDYSVTAEEPLLFDLPPLPKNPGLRVCSDLFHAGGALWVSAAVDPGDDGPFVSYIYRVDLKSKRAEAPAWRLDGLKVEALGVAVVPGSALSVATDDEYYGGIWRPLPKAAGD